ncbi:hypothetical protein ABW20_dc0106296 [Dactylellina cionopaga]|nr:hypothetical protein ABW20_dc0106296 [Dactylellina cionopaga]
MLLRSTRLSCEIVLFAARAKPGKYCFPPRIFGAPYERFAITRRHQSGSSSTSALAYKALHRRVAPLPTTETAPWDASTAVSSILYETPLPSAAPPKRHILNCLVQNEPGVLSRVSGILAARGFNIDSLVVCNTEVEDLSRMTIVLGGQDGVVEQARRQLEDLVPVWAVLDYTAAPLDFHPAKLPASQALRHKMEHLDAVTHLTHQFGGKVLDISTNNVVVEVSAKPARIDAFMKLIAPFGILESARTGLMALPRSPLQGHDDEAEPPKDAGDLVDASSLPPG